jgi:hypothetical protein
MIFPSKFTSLENSTLGKLGKLLEAKKNEAHIIELYGEVEEHFDGVDEFILALDLLYILGKIEPIYLNGTIKYVG